MLTADDVPPVTTPLPSWQEVLTPHLEQTRQLTGAIAIELNYWLYTAPQRQRLHVADPAHPLYNLAAVEQIRAEENAIAELPSSAGVAPANMAGMVYRDTLNRTMPLAHNTVWLWYPAPLSVSEERQLQQSIALWRGYLQTVQVALQNQTRLTLLETTLQRSCHQLRHPLALIRLYVDNLRRDLSEATQQQQALTIRETVDELGHNLSKLLSLEGHGELHWEAIALRSLIARVNTELQPQWQAKNLHLKLPDSDLTIWGDLWRLKQVFGIILSNAIAFSPAAAAITWHWQLAAEPPGFLITLRDRGPGLTPAQCEHIFQPFYSERPGGTGLGLAIAQDILQQHYGQIRALSPPDGGTEIRILLPNPATGDRIGILGNFCL